MKKKIMLILALSSLYANELEIKIIKGLEYQICKDYANNMNLQFSDKQDEKYFTIYQFRKFKNNYDKKFVRLKWEKLEFIKDNLTLFKRINVYATSTDSEKKSLKINQYFYDNFSNKRYWYHDFSIKNKSFHTINLDINFDGKDETLIRMIKGINPHEYNYLDQLGYTKEFIIFIVAIDEDNKSVDINKSKILRQPFIKLTHYDMSTDTNLFSYSNNIYIDSLYIGEFNGGNIEPKIKIEQITKNGQKNICSFKITQIKDK